MLEKMQSSINSGIRLAPAERGFSLNRSSAHQGLAPVILMYATKWYIFWMDRVFKTRYFARWMRKTLLTDAALCRAVHEMVQGLLDADLGGDVVKKRVALPGRGRSGGARTLVATRRAGRWFFVFGFEKNQKANVSDAELEGLRVLASELLALSSAQLALAVEDGALQEICHGS